MVGLLERRPGKGAVLGTASASVFLTLFIYALGRTAQDGLDEAAPVDLLALVASLAGLVTSMVALQRATTDPVSRGRALAAHLAGQVLDAETPRFRQLVGGDTHRINLTYTRLSDPPRPAASSHTEGSMYGRAPGAGPEAGAMPDVQTYFRTTRPQRLVISGGAGAGKTALALELLLALIEDRGNDDPVPLRVALAQWDTARVSLREFVVAHLVTAYGWSRTEAKVVVGQGRVLPVLDGLDEMDSALPDGAPAPDAPRCRAVLERLNAYQEGRHPGSVIVTCRTAHYAALAPRERLRDAARIEVEPVGPDQAGTYLEESGFPRDLLQPVLDELREDPAGTLAPRLCPTRGACLWQPRFSPMTARRTCSHTPRPRHSKRIFWTGSSLLPLLRPRIREAIARPTSSAGSAGSLISWTIPARVRRARGARRVRGARGGRGRGPLPAPTSFCTSYGPSGARSGSGAFI